MIDGERLGEEIGDAFEAMTEIALKAEPLVPRDEQSAFWEAVQRIVALAGEVYVSGEVRTEVRAGQRGVSLLHRLHVAATVEGRPRHVIAGPGTAPEILADLRRQMPSRPRVLNLREFAAGGRAPRPWGPFDLPDDVQRVDRGTPWGNPFLIGEHPDGFTREVVIEKFGFYAAERIEKDPTWLDPLKGKRLACWCAPLACHAEWYVRQLEARGW